MKCLNVILNSASTPRSASHARRALAIANCALLAALVTVSNAGAQMPDPRAPQHPQQDHRPQAVAEKTVSPSGGIMPLDPKPHSPKIERRIVDPNKVAPVTGPGPRREAGGTHGIIFVGGHSQDRIDNDRAALNPQPIPPGRVKSKSHLTRKVKHPNWDVSKNDRA